LDQDVSAATITKFPLAYELGRLNMMLSMSQILIGMFLRSFVHAAVFFFILISLFPEQAEVLTFGSIMFLGLLVTTQIRFLHTTAHWNWMFMFGFAFWFVVRCFVFC
jgi:hypothetical protein